MLQDCTVTFAQMQFVEIPMRFVGIALFLSAWALLNISEAEAATPAQAKRARLCMIDAETIEHSIAVQPEIDKFDESVRYAQRGAGGVEIIEFFDYSCPACRAWHPILKRLVDQNPNVRVEIVDYPIYAKTMVSHLTGNRTLNASLIGLAALKQSNDAALAFHDALMGLRGRVTDSRIKAAALAAEVDLKAAERRAEDADIRQAPVDNIAYAMALGVEGAPGLVVDGVVLRIGPRTPDDLACLVRRAERAGEGG